MINLSTEKTQTCCSDNRCQKQKHLTEPYLALIIIQVNNKISFALFTIRDYSLFANDSRYPIFGDYCTMKLHFVDIFGFGCKSTFWAFQL